MQVGKTSIFVLSLLLSYEAFGANASIRAGALRLNQPQNSVSNTANKTTSEKLSINDTLSSYNRASSLRPNRVQVSGGGNKNPAINEEILKKVYEEMERVTSAVEQELYLTSREIKTLKDEIAEKDEKIKDLELALEDYEEMKETVKNIPNIYYSKKEVDSKGYVMPSTLSSAIETAKSTVKKEALAEVNSKGFITSSAVADEIAQAKTAAVSAAVAQVENMNFATANSVAAAETRMANAIDSAKATITNERNAALQLYAKTSDVASEITLAKNTAIADAKTQTIAAIEDKNYATQQFVNTELSNLDLGIDEAAVGTIIENRLLAKDYATKSFAENEASAALNEAKSYTDTSVNNETTSRQAAINTIDSRLSTYATRTEVDNMVEEAVNPESIATGLLNNNQFKTELVAAVNQDVSALSTRVGALEAEDITINNRLATFSTKQELSVAVADINNTINNLELGIDENVVIGIIDDQFSAKKVLTENSNVFTDVKNTVDAIPSSYYNMQAVDKKIADAVTGGEIDLSGYLKTSDFTAENLTNLNDAIIGVITKQYLMEKLGNTYAMKSVVDALETKVDAIPSSYYNRLEVDQKIADAVTGGEIDLSGYLAKNELTGELKKISDTDICLTRGCVAGQVADAISGLELGVGEDDVIDIINNQFSKNKVLTETSEVFTALRSIVDAIPDTYVLKEGLKDVIEGIKASDGKQLFITRNNVNEAINKPYLMSTLEGEYVSPAGMNSAIAALDDKYVLKEGLKDVIEGIKTSDGEQLFITRNNVDGAIDKDSLAEALLADGSFKAALGEAVVEGLEDLPTDVENLKLSVTELQNEDTIIKGDIAALAAEDTVIKGNINALDKNIADINNTIDNLELGVGEDDVISIIEDQFSKNKVLKENSPVFTALQSIVDAIPGTYVLKADLKDDIEDIKTSDGKQLFITRNNVNEAINKPYLMSTLEGEYVIPDDMNSAIALLDDKFAPKSDVEGIDGRITALQSIVDAIPGTYVLKADLKDDIEDIKTSDGKQLFITRNNVNEAINKPYLMSTLEGEYVIPDDMNSAIALLDDKFAPKSDVEGIDGRITALQSIVDAIPGTYVLKANLKEVIEGIKTSDDKQLFITRNNVNEAIDKPYLMSTLDGEYVIPDDMNSAIALLDDKFAPKSDVEGIDGRITALQSIVDAIPGTYVLKADLQGDIEDIKTSDDKQLFITRNNVNEAIDKPYLMSTLDDAYVIPDDMKSAIAEAQAAAVKEAGEERSAALANYVSKDGLASTIAKDATILEMKDNISANAATADAAQSAADKASTTADAANTAATAAQAVADEAKTIAGTVDGKIGNLSAFGKAVTVAEAISVVADDAATAVQDLGDQLCGDNLQCEGGSFTPSQKQQ